MIPKKHADLMVCEHDPLYMPFEVWSDMDEFDLYELIILVPGVIGVTPHPYSENNAHMVYWDRRYEVGDVMVAVKQALKGDYDA